MRINIGEAARPGLNNDIPGYVLPPNVWTRMVDIKTEDEAIISALGYIKQFTPQVIPYRIAGINDPSGVIFFITYQGDAQVRVFDGTNHFDITPVVVSSSKKWDHDKINNNLIFTNEIDIPTFWDTAVGTPLAPLPGFNATSCRAIKAWKGYIFAMDVTDSGTRFFNRFKWSSQAAEGIPTSWDQSDPASGAGEIDLGEGNTVLLNGGILRDTFFLYGENQTFGVQLVGGQEVWRIYTAFKSYGMLAKHCFVDFMNSHLVVTDGDVRVHNGQTHISVINHKNRKFLFDTISTDNFDNTFVIRSREANEIWICWPRQGETYPSIALVWNYEDDTWTTRELPESTTDIANTVEQTGEVLLWKDANFTWKDAVIKWGERLFNPTLDTLLSGTDTIDPTSAVVEVYKLDFGLTHNGVARESRAERIGFKFDDSENIYVITAVFPRMSGDAVQFEIGSQFVPNGPVTWEGPFDFNPTTDFKFDCRVTGRLHSYRLFGTDKWRLSGLTFEYERVGDR